MKEKVPWGWDGLAVPAFQVLTSSSPGKGAVGCSEALAQGLAQAVLRDRGARGRRAGF